MPSNPPSPFGDLSVEQFLDEYWQKKPLFVEGAFPEFETPLSPEELAGLACEEGVTSRLIQEQGGDYPWQVRFGPFEVEDFTSLPPTHYSLLVQEVDRLIPEVADLLDPFRFLPNWRLDDVMISYAPEHGSVGAHIDSYDVFLLQGLGRRRWEIGASPVEEERYVPELDVRILQDFEPDLVYEVGPGDLLYLPPRVAHHGIALEDCMSYSVGLRAPAPGDLVSGLMPFIAETLEERAPYADPGLRPAEQPGRIDPGAREELRTMVREALEEALSDPARFDGWIGRLLTQPKRGADATLGTFVDEEELVGRLQEGEILRRSAVPHFAHMLHDDGNVTLFVGGQAHEVRAEAAALVPVLTGSERLDRETLLPYLEDPAALVLLTRLVEEGHLWFAA